MELIRIDISRLGDGTYKGELLLAKRKDEQYVICDKKSPRNGQIYHKTHCEIVPEWTELQQENLMHRENVAELTGQRDELREYKEWMDGTLHGKAMQLLKQADSTMQELLEEREVLLQQIERTLDEQKAAIPRQVAEAIDVCKASGLSRIQIVTLMEQVHKLFRDYDKPVLDALTTIKEFAWHTIGGGQDLLSALVNGYTVEQTLEDKLKAGIKAILEQWDTETGFGSFPSGLSLPERITAFIQAEYAKG